MKNIDIKGPIVPGEEKWIYDIFDIEATSPKDVTEILKKHEDEDIQLTINSPGGDVFCASEIYTELKAHKGKVKSRIVGVAASAASVIAMAGDVEMSPTAQIMIHNAWTIAMGDRNDMQGVSDFLKTVDRSIAKAYEKKTGLNESELLSLMDKETWMDAEEAKEKGFIDAIMFEEAPRVSAALPGALPKQVINKMKTNGLKQPESISVDDLRNFMSEMKQEIIEELKVNKSNENKKDKPIKNDWLF